MDSVIPSRPAVLALIVAAVLLLALRIVTRRGASKLPLPPGPRGEPILGHLRLIPTDQPEYFYQRLSKEYDSDILSFNVLGQPVIVLNSLQSAVDLLDKRGANYCDRPRFVLFEVMGWRRTLTFLRWGPEFRTHRRILQKTFQKSNITQFRQLQQQEAVTMLSGLVQSPGNWENVLRQFATAVVMGIGFGVRVEDESSPYIKMAADVSYALAHGGAPAGTPVDFFPILRYLPRWCHDRSLKLATDWRWAVRNIHEKPFEAVTASGEKTPSLIQTMMYKRQAQLDKGEEPELDEDDVKGAAAAVYAAGQDTTWSTLIVFILNMVLHPETQEKARHALDEAVGRGRLPTFEDRPNLLFIDDIVQETLRWCPVSPIGVPHRSLEDDTYKGYFIPAGAFVYANARAMTHDEQFYKNPDAFDPERYRSTSEGGRGEPYPNGNFGFGRRVCVGKYLAEASVWIVVARLLSTMRIEKVKDDKGQDVEPVVELTNGLSSYPKHFPCSIVPRDEQAVRLIRTALQ